MSRTGMRIWILRVIKELQSLSCEKRWYGEEHCEISGVCEVAHLTSNLNKNILPLWQQTEKEVNTLILVLSL